MLHIFSRIFFSPLLLCIGPTPTKNPHREETPQKSKIATKIFGIRNFVAMLVDLTLWLFNRESRVTSHSRLTTDLCD